MDNKLTEDFVNSIWDESIIPELCEYIKIPNKSPMFDPDWEKHGHMEEQWLKFDDKNVNQFDLNLLPKETYGEEQNEYSSYYQDDLDRGTTTAYILVYERKTKT